MKRKTFLTILIGIVIVIVVGIIAFLIISFWKGNQGGEQDSGFSLFPNRDGNSGVIKTPDEPTDETLVDEPTDGGVTQKVARLRRLADFPVIALSAYYRPEKVVVERIIQTPTEESVDENGEIVIEKAAAAETVTEILDINQLYARYIKHEDGAVFTSKIANTLSQQQTTLGSIPYAGDGLVGNNGKSIVYRFFNDNSQTIETFMGTISKKIIPAAVCATPLLNEITSDSDTSQIILLQEFLAYTLESDVISDGQLGATTKKMLRDFQNLEGLDTTGLADSSTLASINNTCIPIVEEKIAANNPINLDGVFLTENISAMSMSPSTEDLVYFTEQKNETIIVTLNFATRALRQVFTTPFSEWTPYWTGKTTVNMHTKPSGLVEGYFYNLDTETGNLSKIEDGILGLTGVANSIQNKIFTSSGGDDIISRVFDTINGKNLIVSFSTLPEKCVWAQDGIIIYCAVPDFVGRGLYPDDWYKGKVSFTDSMWSLNTATGETRQIANLSTEGGEDFDVIKPTLEENELYLFFINKKTGEPWVLEI